MANCVIKKYAEGYLHDPLVQRVIDIKLGEVMSKMEPSFFSRWNFFAHDVTKRQLF
jgi:hypothetical protein